MPPPRTQASRKISAHGMEISVFVPGAFYQGVYPGGFTDSQTGIHIPGPKAILDGTYKREVVGLCDLPEPVQLPHYKMVVEVSESGKVRKEVKVDFNANDEMPVYEAFQMALSTGLIRVVPDDIMEEKYPMTYASRKDEIIYYTENAQKANSMTEMLDDAQAQDKMARFSVATTKRIKNEQELLQDDLLGKPHDEPESSVKRPPPPPKR